MSSIRTVAPTMPHWMASVLLITLLPSVSHGQVAARPSAVLTGASIEYWSSTGRDALAVVLRGSHVSHQRIGVDYAVTIPLRQLAFTEESEAPDLEVGVNWSVIGSGASFIVRAGSSPSAAPGCGAGVPVPGARTQARPAATTVFRSRLELVSYPDQQVVLAGLGALGRSCRRSNTPSPPPPSTLITAPVAVERRDADTKANGLSRSFGAKWR